MSASPSFDEEISYEKNGENETEPRTPTLSSSSSLEEQEQAQEERTTRRRPTSRIIDNNNDDDIDTDNFDRNRTRIEIRDNFNNELQKLKNNSNNGDINEIYKQALENIKTNIPNSDKFNLTFRKDKNGNYNGLIILNRFSKRKPTIAATLPPPLPPGEPMRTMKRRTFSKIPKIDEPASNDDNDNDLLLPPTPPIPQRTPRRRTSTVTTSIKNTDRRGPVRRAKTDQALETTVKNLASQIEKINNRLHKMKTEKNDKQLMKVARRNLKSMVRDNSNNGLQSQLQPQDYSSVFEKIYNEAYENSLNGGNNNGYNVEDIKREAIKYFH